MGIVRHSSNEPAVKGAPGADRGGALQQGGAGGFGTESRPSSHAAAERRGKVVLLRGPRRAKPEQEMLGTSELRLDLHAPIDCLRSIRGDLDVQYWGRRGQGEPQDSERYQISLWIKHVSERTAALEGILMHMGGPAVVLSDVGPAECEALRSATNALACWIREEESFQDVRRSVAAILHAVDTICLSAAAGERPETPSRVG